MSTREQGIGPSWLVSKESPPDCVQNLELSDECDLQDYQLATVVLDQMIWETKEVMTYDFPKTRFWRVYVCVGECVSHNNPTR